MTITVINPFILQAATPPSWTPSDLSDLEAWWDFTEESTGSLSTISDLSGNGYTMSQSTGTRQPTITASAIGSKNAAYFDGGDYLEDTTNTTDLYSSANGWTIIAVVEPEDNGSNEGFIWSESTRNTNTVTFALNTQPPTSRVYRVVNRGNASGFVAGVCTNTKYTDQGEQYVIVDGTKTTFDAQDSDGNTDSSVSLFSTTMTQQDMHSIGVLYWQTAEQSQTYFKGYIAEIILMKNRITGSELTNLKSYFSTKYGL